MAGIGVLLLAAGAVLRFAVSDSVEGVDLSVVGVILMIVGGLAVLLSLIRGVGGFRSTSERHVSADGQHVVEETRTRDI